MKPSPKSPWLTWLLASSALAATPLGSVVDLAWIAGDWVGRLGEAVIEESWAPPAGGTMMGMFRLVDGGAVRFYEFMTIEPSEEGPQLRIKHYDPGLVGWEEKTESVKFRLIELGDRRAVFETRKEGHPERLIYTRDDEGLVIVLDKPADGSRTEFRYRPR